MNIYKSIITRISTTTTPQLTNYKSKIRITYIKYCYIFNTSFIILFYLLFYLLFLFIFYLSFCLSFYLLFLLSFCLFFLFILFVSLFRDKDTTFFLKNPNFYVFLTIINYLLNYLKPTFTPLIY